MKAVRIQRFGGPEQVAVEDVPCSGRGGRPVGRADPRGQEQGESATPFDAGVGPGRGGGGGWGERGGS
jgi:hypothetical protein